MVQCCFNCWFEYYIISRPSNKIKLDYIKLSRVKQKAMDHKQQKYEHQINQRQQRELTRFPTSVQGHISPLANALGQSQTGTHSVNQSQSGRILHTIQQTKIANKKKHFGQQAQQEQQYPDDEFQFIDIDDIKDSTPKKDKDQSIQNSTIRVTQNNQLNSDKVNIWTKQQTEIIAKNQNIEEEELVANDINSSKMINQKEMVQRQQTQNHLNQVSKISAKPKTSLNQGNGRQEVQAHVQEKLNISIIKNTEDIRTSSLPAESQSVSDLRTTNITDAATNLLDTTKTAVPEVGRTSQRFQRLQRPKKIQQKEESKQIKQDQSKQKQEPIQKTKKQQNQQSYIRLTQQIRRTQVIKPTQIQEQKQQLQRVQLISQRVQLTSQTHEINPIQQTNNLEEAIKKSQLKLSNQQQRQERRQSQPQLLLLTSQQQQQIQKTQKQNQNQQATQHQVLPSQQKSLVGQTQIQVHVQQINTQEKQLLQSKKLAQFTQDEVQKKKIQKQSPAHEGSLPLKRTDSNQFNAKQKESLPFQEPEEEQNTFTRSKMLQASKKRKNQQIENQQINSIQRAFESRNQMRQSSSNSNMRMSMQKLKSSQSQKAMLKKEPPQNLHFKTKFTIIEQALAEEDFNKFQTIQRNLKSELCQNQAHKFFVKYLAYDNQTQFKKKQTILYAQPCLKQFEFQKVAMQKIPLLNRLSIIKGLLECIQLCHRGQYMLFPKDLSDFLCLKYSQKQQSQIGKTSVVNEDCIKFMSHLLEPIGDLLSSKHPQKDFINKYIQNKMLKHSFSIDLIPQIRYHKMLKSIKQKKEQLNKKIDKNPKTQNKKNQKIQKEKEKQQEKQQREQKIYEKVCNQAKDIYKTDIFCIGIWILNFLFPNHNLKKTLTDMMTKNYQFLLLAPEKEKQQDKIKQTVTKAINNDNSEKDKDNKKGPSKLDVKSKINLKNSSNNKQTKAEAQGKLENQKQTKVNTNQELQKQDRSTNFLNSQANKNQIQITVVTAKQIIQTLKLDPVKNKFQVEVLNFIVNLLNVYPTKRSQLGQTIRQLTNTINKMHGQFTKDLFVKAKLRYRQEIDKIQYIQNFGAKFGEELQLLDNQNKKKLTEFIKKNNNKTVKGFKLVYKASHFSFKAKFFHQYCYQKQHLLVVVQPKSDKKIFCYSQQSFDLKKCNGIFGNYIKDLKGFSFIYNGEEFSKLKNKEKAIGVCSTYGPIFGDGDLVIGDGNLENYSQFPKSYQANKRKKLLKNQKFQLQEYDVYEVQF